MNYKLEKEEAIKSSGFERITETGKYVGKFTRAEAIVSQYGTKGIEFTFVDDYGNSADFLSLYTVKSSGEKIFGYRQLMALMTCLKTKEIEKDFGTVPKYDFKSGQTKQTKAEVYPALMNKPIGVILQAEEYKNHEGDIKQRMNIVSFFEASTGRTAKEIFDDAPAEEADKLLARLPKVKGMKGDSKPVSKPVLDINPDDIPF